MTAAPEVLEIPVLSRLTSEYETARLQRAVENARWRRFDEPSYLRLQARSVVLRELEAA